LSSQSEALSYRQ